MATQADIVNAALLRMNDQAYVSGTLPNFDGSPAGLAAGILYPIVRDLLLRMIMPDFAMRIGVTLVAAADPPAVPWAYAYNYPADCLRMRQVRWPKTGAGAPADQNLRPRIPAAVAYDSAGAAKIVLTNQQNALAAYVTNGVDEVLWDGGFVDAMDRTLSSPLAMALAGRPDFSRELLQEAERYSSLASENAEL